MQASRAGFLLFLLLGLGSIVTGLGFGFLSLAAAGDPDRKPLQVTEGGRFCEMLVLAGLAFVIAGLACKIGSAPAAPAQPFAPPYAQQPPPPQQQFVPQPQPSGPQAQPRFEPPQT
ncbi:hypothetical protein [Actinomadura flavalba]|uniref:hypothetical protein n=1 Tax=Actinomadura flavalba TaxID=1120938 RepID=UPI000380C9CA|nr:hypothetical protein [Actinomadura flavalba]